MNISAADAIKLLADGLALVYHEARNARHLIDKEHLQRAGWERLLSSLPKDRIKAWQAIQPARRKAGRAHTAAEAADCFEHQYARSLLDLESLYANTNWKHANAFGGHQWRHFTAAVIMLRNAIEQGGADNLASTAHSLLCARHNTGTVQDKILRLDDAIGLKTSPYWRDQKRVLFVCAGNTCRSPMAEAIARRILSDTICVESAGISAVDGAPASPEAIKVMSERRLDIRDHSARGIDTVGVSTFDVIVAMDATIARSLRSRGADPAAITELNIPDPYGESMDCYRATADSIAVEIGRTFQTNPENRPKRDSQVP